MNISRMEQKRESVADSTEQEINEHKPSALQWNLLGWYGSSFGATAWMMVTPFFLSWPTKGVFAGIVGTLVVWSFASIAWGLRARVSALKGIFGLLTVTVLANLGFLLFAHANELPLDSAANAIETNYVLYYLALLILVISLMLLFWLKEKRAEK